MLQKLKELFPANRIAAIATWLAGVAAFIVGVTKSLPEKWQDGAVAIAGVLTALVTALHYMTGSQKYDALVLGNATTARITAQETEIEAALNGPETAVTPDPEK